MSPSLPHQVGDGSLRAISYLFIFLLVAVVALRFYARLLAKSKLGADDVLIVPAALTCVILCILSIISLHLRLFDLHFEQYQIKVAIEGYKFLVAFEWMYITSTAFAKLSLLAFLLRIFPQRSFRYSVFALMFVTGGLWLASAFVITFQCAPVAYAWDKGIEGGTCINQLDFFRYVAVPNILTDVCMLVLPLPEIWNLQLSRLQKVGLTAIFLSGLLGTIATCLRMNAFLKGKDFDLACWTAVDWLSWTIVEPAMYIIAACIPSYRILFPAQIIPWAQKLYGSTKGSGSTSQSQRSQGPRISLPIQHQFYRLDDLESRKPGLGYSVAIDAKNRV